jgi:hypothetical protein
MNFHLKKMGLNLQWSTILVINFKNVTF